MLGWRLLLMDDGRINYSLFRLIVTIGRAMFKGKNFGTRH